MVKGVSAARKSALKVLQLTGNSWAVADPANLLLNTSLTLAMVPIPMPYARGI